MAQQVKNTPASWGVLSYRFYVRVFIVAMVVAFFPFFLLEVTFSQSQTKNKAQKKIEKKEVLLGTSQLKQVLAPSEVVEDFKWRHKLQDEDMYQAYSIDLNYDGERDIIIDYTCGNTSCLGFYYSFNGRFLSVLEIMGCLDFRISNKTTKGFRNVHIGYKEFFAGGGWTTRRFVYKWDGTQYLKSPEKYYEK